MILGNESKRCFFLVISEPSTVTESIWVFPKIGVPQNGWFTMENPIKMDGLGLNTPIFGNTHIVGCAYISDEQMSHELGVTRVKMSLQIDRKYPASEVFLGLTSLGIQSPSENGHGT